jgi:serine/threonine protein kinase
LPIIASSLSNGVWANVGQYLIPQSIHLAGKTFPRALHTTSTFFAMGLCHSKHDSTDDVEASRSVPTQREDRHSIRLSSPIAGNSVREEINGDERINAEVHEHRRSNESLKEIEYDILLRLKASEVGAKDKPIILPESVKAIWAPTYYRWFYMSYGWYDKAWNKTNSMDQYIQIMSILIRMNFGEWDQFGAIFIDQKDRYDKHLPFTLEELQQDDFLGKANGMHFHREQWAFCPIRIQEQGEELEMDQDRRLPWIDDPKAIGEGAFGKVTKRTVAEGFLTYKNLTVNPTVSLSLHYHIRAPLTTRKPKAVAVKTVSDADAFKDEFKNLKNLRDCLSDHERIMVNLVTMVDKSIPGSNLYHMVYELAAYDLNVFLTHMPQALREERHATASRERTGSANMWPGDLISESVNLADALDYLHNRLYSRSHISLSHNDIKPENILVVYPDTTNIHDRFPVGQWKFADFGLSEVKLKRPSDSRHLSADNVSLAPPQTQETHRTTRRPTSVSKALPARHPGQYTAPELDQTPPQLTDCRSSDVWSFGCVLTEIVTYAVKLDCRLVEDFRESLGKSEQPGQRDPPDQRFYDHETKDVKSQFSTHIANLPSLAHGDKRIPRNTHWIGSCADLIKEIVVKEPRLRPKANIIREKLSVIDLSMRDDKDVWLSHDLKLDLTNISADTAWSAHASAATQSPVDMADTEFDRDGALTRVPSICIHPAKHSTSEPINGAPMGIEDRRRATAPK